MRTLCILLTFCFTLCCTGLKAQGEVRLLFTTDVDALPQDSVRPYRIGQITIEGNGQTRPSVLHRELGLSPGESHSLFVLCAQLVNAKNALMRSGLFRGVSLSLMRTTEQTVDVMIQVEERWYLFPEPFVKPVDYSFLEWIADDKRSTSRINYGVRLTHRNFTGRNDKLHLGFTNGFSRYLGLQYQGLYLDKAMRWYSNFSVGFGKNRAVNVVTEDNRTLPIQTANNDFVHSYFNASADVTFRPAIKSRHTFGIGLVQESVSDTIKALSQGMRPQVQNTRYVNLYYHMAYADVDLMAYPTRGRITELSIVKKGFSSTMQLWQLSARNSLTWPWKRKYIVNLQGAAVLKLPFQQPRQTKGVIGAEGRFMQGYEDYLIEGVAGGYVKASLARPLMGKTLYAPAKWVPNKLQRFRALPFKLYARGFVNTGYVHDPQPFAHSLSNRLLLSAGLGLDVVAFADWVVKIEWSVNLLGQNGLYLHPHNSF